MADNDKSSVVPSTVTLITLGCAKNEADSRHMQELIVQAGFRWCETPVNADFILVNTCAFIQDATEESLDTILELADGERLRSGNAKLLVVGCLPSRYGAELVGELPEVADFVDVAHEGGIVQVLERHGARAAVSTHRASDPPVADTTLLTGSTGQAPGVEAALFLSNPTDTLDVPSADNPSAVPALPFESSLETTVQPWAYVKISDGCSRACTYCTIPQIRGPYKSRPFAAIAAEIDELINTGVGEIILIGQDTGIWTDTSVGTATRVTPTTATLPARAAPVTDGVTMATPATEIAAAPVTNAPVTNAPVTNAPTASSVQVPTNLPELLKYLAVYYPNTWFRVMYLQPQGISDELLAVMAAHDNICNYLDMPLQHASRRILTSMGRSGSKDEYLSLIAKIRRALPNVALRTTLIAGFPGEEDVDFLELERFVIRARFDYLGVFAYSREQGTVAAALPGHLSQTTRLVRAQRLRDIGDNIGMAQAATHIGSRATVLVCGSDDDGIYGRSQAQAPDVDGVVYLKPESAYEKSRDVVVGKRYDVRIYEAVCYDLFGEVFYAR
ncbi:MAG: radical SAM protein [Coriobacteriales bacterium]|jgi:ribosomal protein S12 methylthiotransferase|nr:radical SAM protein [Coriobacteriales bacterium]